ncbi:hypothetical protein COU54_00290 [Candidatus Pacearchaeota archaeon CG10_big_fil_rev_8_21_14_0_10_31_24]|nr:MAG: hypothetical protein COU54_00290 [Candidatus Pacearchaeota archaeon CG10_big_fil_rev_8_21_14_0_10_31_24]
MKKNLISLLTGALLFTEGCLYPDKAISNPQLRNIQIYLVEDKEGKVRESVRYDVEDNLPTNIRSRASFYDDEFDGNLNRVKFNGQMNGEKFYMELEEGDKDIIRLKRSFEKTLKIVGRDERYCDGQLENRYFDIRNEYFNESKE